ncbi:D-tyrosyl-tRNA(Tyr) deacylase [bacterium]|nr:D-tyrosyl-tRNA(Tyr) deacylase [bacterium]
MRALIQRTQGIVRIDSELGELRETHSFEGKGLVVLLGWTKDDETRPIEDLVRAEAWILSRVRGLRIFPDSEGRMNLALSAGGILWVPQFTLAATIESGFRPSFSRAMAPERAKERFERFKGRVLETPQSFREIFGVFGADMNLSFTNWGPVTIPLES